MIKKFRRSASLRIMHWAVIKKIMHDNPDLPRACVAALLQAQKEAAVGRLSLYTFDTE